MRFYKIIALSLLVVGGCKTTKPVVSEVKADAETKTTGNEVINGHYASKKDFKTLYLKASARYEDDKQTQNVTAEIRIKKDEKILVSIRFLGITMAKALITPTEVKYYEKINGEYFEGDYQMLSRWLGTELDYSKVQNLLIGQALDDLTKGKYKTSIEDKLYKLEETSDRNTQKTYYFEAGNFLVKKEEIAQPSQKRSLEVTYPNYTSYNQAMLPTQVLIKALQSKGKTNIQIEYNSAAFDQELSFPYSVPEGYEKQTID